MLDQPRLPLRRCRLYAPTQAELSGPAGAPLGVTVTLADHPAEHLEPAEEAQRLRRLATDLEAEVARDAVDPLPEEP